MASRKTKRRLLRKRWEKRQRRMVEKVTRRLLGEPDLLPAVNFPIGNANGSGEALNNGMTYSFGFNLYNPQPRMSAVVYGISGV